MKKVKKNLKDMKAPSVHKRSNLGSLVNRELKKSVRGENAKRSIGELYPGCEIYGFTKGQFSLIEILEHCIMEAGPAQVTICTWSAAAGDIQAANRLLSNKNITDLKFIVDYSFQARKPHFCKELIDTFGVECIRVTSIHAKFATVKSDKFNLTIRTSMNLNYNPRFENFEISDDPGLLAFMDEIVAEIWETQDAAEGFSNRPSDNVRQFKSMFVDDAMNQDVSIDDLTPVILD